MGDDVKHFVLVHGVCHGSWCWYRLIALFKQAGHRVTALDLGACGINPKELNDITSIWDYVHSMMELIALFKQAGHRVTALDLGACGINPKELNDITSIWDYVHSMMELYENQGVRPPSIRAGHMVMLSKPSELCQRLLEVAGRYHRLY
ncbi:polyneuridine-aldehyde esterase [Quercus suber]|uniref:Polyneuridine-aldehyde esterase n=1 Tax=Quercus suber TaxID=58331 RepID=A0AAW0LAY3_QUESU